MSWSLRQSSITGLRWTLGVILLLESVHFALSRAAARELTRNGLPHWLPPALGGTEALAALLFLVPALSAVGGGTLLAIFAIAAVLHFLQGQFNIGSLVIYAMAVIVCLAHPARQAAETPHDR